MNEKDGAMTEQERRRDARRKIDPLPVFISQRKANYLIVNWLLGEITDVSTSGAKIRMIDHFSLKAGASIEILCFPRNVIEDADLQTTPSRMTATVVWTDGSTGCIGIAFTS